MGKGGGSHIPCLPPILFNLWDRQFEMKYLRLFTYGEGGGSYIPCLPPIFFNLWDKQFEMKIFYVF